MLINMNGANRFDATGELTDDLYFGWASAEISQVTIPSAAQLLGSGLIGMLGIRRKTKN